MVLQANNISENLLKKHISFDYCRNIQEICHHFFRNKSLQISYLNYIQRNNDGTVFYLCSNREWLKHYYDMSYPSIGEFEHNEELCKLRYILWSSLNSGDIILKDSKEIIHVTHGITIVDKLSQGYGYYNFGCTDQNSFIINQYISHLDTLNAFIKYFKQKASWMLLEIEKHRFILPHKINDSLRLFEPASETKEIENLKKIAISFD